MSLDIAQAFTGSDNLCVHFRIFMKIITTTKEKIRSGRPYPPDGENSISRCEVLLTTVFGGGFVPLGGETSNPSGFGNALPEGT
ncbi:TPA: hypothetical protein JAW27_004216 [Citrobacter freundii]|uniref:hypothetical protein n=1 Tax=Citrobacter freundii TaxID=546 RepID=UPI0015776B4B|nr:hypothetical protein [Citrobacter freundii]EMB4340292.1 hypothetical protein [Citrobacter freundii]NTY75019.1 hypothetical protein [Citrobacter freundii]HAT7546478.1 hypothetical protein [Citrobacter freundii]